MIRVKIKQRPLRALCFDLESRPLAFWYGDKTTAEITAFGWKWLDEPDVHTLVLRDGQLYEDDEGRKVPYQRAHELFGMELASSGLAYAHNCRRFDLPLLAGWRLRLGLPPLPELLTTDTLRDLYRRTDVSASLESLVEYLDIEVGKHRMSAPKWERANQLRRDGVAEARVRVSTDVLIQEEARKRLLDRGQLRDPRVWRP